MKNASPLTVVYAAAVLFTLCLPFAEAAPKQNAREFRPLSAKAVRITVAAPAEHPGTAGAMTRKGWAHFDKKEWEKAMDGFLSALEADSTDESAAEGLTMAVYRSGDRASAAKLAEEFSEVMPWIRGMVAETVLANVRTELETGGLASAEALMGELPYGAGAYDRVRDLVEGAVAERAEAAKSTVAQRGE